jgi:hypothetical protein
MLKEAISYASENVKIRNYLVTRPELRMEMISLLINRVVLSDLYMISIVI